jgi:hypothetical protein
VTCDLADMSNKVQRHPCIAAEIDRNWDNTKFQFDILADNIRRLEACIAAGGSGSGVRRFKLTAGLTLGGSAAGVLQEWSSGAWIDDGDPIVVKDVNQAPGFWQGAIGYGGWCVAEPGSTTNWHIVWMEHKAKWIRYTLTEALISTDADCTVNDYMDGIDPGPTATVFDPQQLYQFWHQIGCKGWARWNPENARYEIVSPQLVAKFIHAALDEDVCDGDNDDVAITYSSSLNQGFHQNAPEPLPTTALNPRKHVGVDGKNVLLMGRVSDGVLAYEIVDMEKQELDVVTEVTLQGCTFGYRLTKVFVETCLERTSGTVATFTQIDVPVSFYTESDYEAESPYCRVKAATKTICTIEVDDGADLTVFSATSQTVVTDIYSGYDPSNDGNSETDPSCGIYGTRRDLWVLCVEPPETNVLLIDLYIQDVVTGFTQVSDTDECSGTLTTTKFCMIRPEVADAAIPGDPLVIYDCTKQSFLADVYDEAPSIMGTLYDGWFICLDGPSEEELITTEECADDEVIDEGAV